MDSYDSLGIARRPIDERPAVDALGALKGDRFQPDDRATARATTSGVHIGLRKLAEAGIFG